MKKRYLYAIGIIIFCTFIMSTATWAKSSEDHNALDTIVETKYGKVEGYVGENNTLVWKSIPYAKPPIEEWRWRAPQDLDPWTGTRLATEPCEPCSQMELAPGTYAPIGPMGSEDCLYLNVFRPRDKIMEKKLPVYVFIHGGSNNYGSIQSYDGSAIAARGNMIVVTIQYRLGPLGWLTHPALRDDENELDASGNFGTLDTFKALEWIQENIAAFGGNPNNVLITGESAGAHNVVNCVVSPLAGGLFHKAMSQSGGMKTVTMDAGDTRTGYILSTLATFGGSVTPPVDNVETYLRDKTMEELIIAYVAAQELFNLPPLGLAGDAFRDGVVIPEGGVVAAIESGNYSKVPIILGSNEDEMKFFLPLFPIPTSTGKNFTDLFGVLYPDSEGNYTEIDEVLSPSAFDRQLYQSCAEFGSLNWRYNYVDLLARSLKEQQDKVYAYHFRWDGVEGSDYNAILGAAHATEIPFFFGDPSDIYFGIAFNEQMDTPGRKALSEAMMDYLSNFVHGGNPNGAGLPVWQKWSNEEGAAKVIVFDANEDLPEIEMIDEEITAADVDATFWGLYSLLPPETGFYMFLFDWY